MDNDANRSTNEDANLPLLSVNEDSTAESLAEPVEIRNQLGTLAGCYVPCLLNILGVVLFLRLPWAVGQSGVGGILLMFLLGETQAILTVLSLSALVSNGRMKGGGNYFLVSRGLGPELGGSIGVLFYIAYAVGSTFYAIGFAEELMGSFWPNSSSSDLRIIIASLTLICVLIVSLVGANAFTKVNIYLFVVQEVSIVVVLLSVLFIGHRSLSNNTYHESPSVDLFQLNWSSNYDEDKEKCKGLCSFAKVFAIIFPAMTGINEGANLSGDLRNPAKSIAKGTLWAIFTSIITYLGIVLSVAFTFTPSSLKNNDLVLQESSIQSYIVIIGVLVCTGSSALGAIFGGSRILQALARDNLFPGLQFLGAGSKHGDEPRRAVLFTYAISQACVFLGNLDALAPLCTSFFCLSYSITNFAVVLQRLSGAPNFRPAFQWWSWQLSLIGGILNISVMFWLDLYVGLISVGLLFLLFLLLVYRNPLHATREWGGVTQALLFHQVRKYLLLLDEEQQEHVKLWRPSILLFVDFSDSTLLDFCNQLKKGGLYILGTVIRGQIEHSEVKQMYDSAQVEMRTIIKKKKLKAFVSTITCSTSRDACSALLQLSGIGALKPRTIVLPFLDFSVQSHGYLSCVKTPLEYLQILKDTEQCEKNLIIGANFQRNPVSLVEGNSVALSYISQDYEATQFIDVWITACSSTTLHLILQLAHIVSQSKSIRSSRLRLFRLVDDQEDQTEHVAALKQVERETRIKFTSIECIQSTKLYEAIVANSISSHVIFVPLPAFPDELTKATAQQYYEGLHSLTNGLPPILFVASNGSIVVNTSV